MKKRTAFTLMVLLILNILNVSILAAIPPGCTSTDLNASYVAQAKDNWCWAASAENAIIWENTGSTLTRTQYDAVWYLKGSPWNPHPDIAGSIYDSQKAAEYISSNTIAYTASETKESYSFLCEEIFESHPVIVGAGYYTSSGIRNGGHATLITGWSTASGKNYLTYFDSATNTYETCTYNAFCDGTYNNRKYDQTCHVTKPTK